MKRNKNIRKYLLVVCMLVLLPSVTLALDAKSILSKTQALYKDAAKIEYSSNYELFSGHTGTDLMKSYSGYYYRSNNLQYQKIGASEYVYGKDFFLTLEHEEKVIQLYNAQKSTSEQTDVSAFLKLCKSSTAEDKGDHYLVKMTFGSAAQIPVNEIVLQIDKDDYHLIQMDLFYANTSGLSEEGKLVPAEHLKITFSKFSVKPKDHSELLDLSKYIEKKESGLAVQSFYAGYELNDNRLK